jgi:hypothetical protein
MNGSHQSVEVWVDFTATQGLCRPGRPGSRILRRATLAAGLLLGALAGPLSAVADETSEVLGDEAVTALAVEDAAAMEDADSAPESADMAPSHLASRGFVLKDAEVEDGVSIPAAMPAGVDADTADRPPALSPQTPPAAIPFPSALQLFAPGAGLALYMIRQVRRRGVWRR